jgi:hypothetical protein
MNLDYTEDGDEPRITKESHFWVSDNREYDTMFVQKCFKMHWNGLLIVGCSLDSIGFSQMAVLPSLNHAIQFSLWHVTLASQVVAR